MSYNCYSCNKNISGHASLYTDALNRHYCDSNCRDDVTGEVMFALYNVMTDRFRQYLNDKKRSHL